MTSLDHVGRLNDRIEELERLLSQANQRTMYRQRQVAELEAQVAAETLRADTAVDAANALVQSVELANAMLVERDAAHLARIAELEAQVAALAGALLLLQWSPECPVKRG